MICGVEEVVGLEVGLPLMLFPRETGIRQEVGAIIVGLAIEIGVRAYTILPSASGAEVEASPKGYAQIGHEFVAQIF